MVVKRLVRLFLCVLVYSSFLSCGREKVYILSDPQLQELEGNFVKERIRSSIKSNPTRYEVLQNPEEIFSFIEAVKANEKNVRLVLSPFFWNLHERLEKDPDLQIVWMNINPYEEKQSVYCSWDLLVNEISLADYIPQGNILVFFSKQLLSQEQISGLKLFLDSGLDIQWKEVSLESLNQLENEIDLSLYDGFILASGTINPALYNTLAKQNTPVGGEIPYLEIPDDLWFLKIEDNWSLIVEEALNQFSEDPSDFPVPVVPLWEGNEPFRRP